MIALVAGCGSLLAPGWVREIWTAAGMLGTATIVLEILAALSGLKRRSPSVFEEALHLSGGLAPRPADLEALERALGWRTYSGAEYDHRVRPILRRSAIQRLGDKKPSIGLAELLSDRPTSGSVRTAEITDSVTEIEEL